MIKSRGQVMKQYFGIIIVFASFLGSCSTPHKTAKQELSDGFYLKKSKAGKSKVYIDIVGETILIHPTAFHNSIIVVDTLRQPVFFLPEVEHMENTSFSLLQNSFDIDFLTIPLKLRPSQNGIPTQLNANLNGAIYLGYRIDDYKIKYNTNPLNTSVRKITHQGFSFGFFGGFGSTFISPTNTNNYLQQEYDGIVWNKGIAGILGVNNFTVGISVGFDNLLDKNKNVWIYENKPWIGLAFGLNLN